MVKEKELKSIFFRYSLLLISGLSNLFIFYLVFTPLTIYLSYIIINIFLNVSLSGDMITFGDNSIQIVEACVAGSAYYLLLILNLSTPKIDLLKRFKMIIFSFLTLLIMNVLRIVVLSFILLESPSTFNKLHYFFWFFLSTIFVLGIWFYQVKKYRIKEIPIYSDLKNFRKLLIN